MPVEPRKGQRFIHVFKSFQRWHDVQIGEAHHLSWMVQRQSQSDTHATVMSDQVKALKAKVFHHRDLVTGAGPLAVGRKVAI